MITENESDEWVNSEWIESFHRDLLHVISLKEEMPKLEPEWNWGMVLDAPQP